MRARGEIWTILLVTLVTLLIWAWAAGETQETATGVVRFEFDNTNTDLAVIRMEPAIENISVSIEGSNHALNQFSQLSRESVMSVPWSETGLSREPGTYTVDLQSLMERSDLVTDTGITILECTPPTIEVEIDRMVDVTCEIVPRSRRSQLQFDDVVFDPPRVTMRMPLSRRQTFPAEINVYADFDNANVDARSSAEQTASIPLRKPDRLAANELVTLGDASTEATFTIRSQSLETTIDSVVVWMYGPPADGDDYSVEFTPSRLQDVTVRGSAETIRRITNGELIVVAMIQLSSREKEQGVRKKSLTGIVAMPREANDIFVPVFLEATIAGQTTMPEIDISIADRADEDVSSE